MPERRAYWLALFTHATWQEFIDQGARIVGFRQHRWKSVHQIRSGDYLLCYLTGASRWIGLFEAASFPYLERAPRWEEVVSAPYCASAPLWEEDEFPAKVKVKPLVTLFPETAVPILSLKEELSLFRNLPHPHAWVAQVRHSPARWKTADGEAVVRALLAAGGRPVEAGRGKLEPAGQGSRPGAFSSSKKDTLAEKKVNHGTSSKEATAHTEIQWLLLKLGNDMGFDVWVARNDKGREYDGHKFSGLARFRDRLPLQFDEGTNQIIELIDVLWLKGNAIVAAFEIESTTSVYSGLLRMADLVTLQPNLNMPLYLVAPDERRDKVIHEVNRPTFSRLSPPLSEICRLIVFSELREKISQVSPFLRYLKPDFLEEISETCATDDA